MALRATKQLVRELQLNLDGGAEEVTKRRKPVHEEAMHQAALMAHRNKMQAAYPHLQFLFSTLNGIFLPPHIRAKAIEAGLAKGILDLFYMVRHVEAEDTAYCGLAMDGAHTTEVYTGLAMELKKLKGGRPTPEQLEWASHLVAQGWRVYFPEGCLDAWRCLAAYEGITGEDNWAEDLQRAEQRIRESVEA